MSSNEQLKRDAEVALWQSTKHFRALRSVAFLIETGEGNGLYEWNGQPLMDLAALLDVVAQQGLEHAEAGLEALQSVHLGAMLPQA